jgi:polyisoprenoid-binding protein YceI
MRSYLLLAAPLLIAATPPGPESLAFDPNTAQASFTVHALGFWPFEGEFRRFDGQIRLDPGRPGACAVALAIDLSSLHMPNPAMQADVLSPALLDVAVYPRLQFSGACNGLAIDGTMTLHGQTHPMHLDVHRQQGRWIAVGHFRRSEWGIIGRPLLAGQDITVRFSVAAPP